jgi:hypothetical protein
MQQDHSGSAPDERRIPPFEIFRLRRANFRRIPWTFSVRFFPVHEIQFALATHDDGAFRHAVPSRVKDAFSRRFVATASVENAFARAVFRAVCSIIKNEPDFAPNKVWRFDPGATP